MPRYMDDVPRMLRNAPPLRRSALLIRGPLAPPCLAAWVPALRSGTSCRTAFGTRGSPKFAPSGRLGG